MSFLFDVHVLIFVSLREHKQIHNFFNERIMYPKDKFSHVTALVGFLSLYWDTVHLIPSVPDIWVLSLFFVLFDIISNYRSELSHACLEVVKMCKQVFAFLRCGLSMIIHFVQYYIAKAMNSRWNCFRKGR